MLRKNKQVQRAIQLFLELTTRHKEIIVICNNALQPSTIITVL